MCGRFTLSRSGAEIAAHFDLPAIPALARRYNVAPGQDVAVVLVGADRSDGARGDVDARRLELRRWGLLPGWAKTPNDGSRRINARLETVATKPSFRAAFKTRRALVPADGYYEWQVARGAKLPYHLALPDGALFAIAAIYEHWEDKTGRALETVALLTCEAIGDIREIHTRMPVILSPAAYAAWLDPSTDASDALALCEPGLALSLEAKRVGKRVNRVSHDDPACLELEALPLFER